MSRVKAIVAAVLFSLSLASCGSSQNEERPRKLYDVTLYGGGTVICEWNHVTNYYIYSDNRTAIIVDGEMYMVIGGTLVIKEEE